MPTFFDSLLQSRAFWVSLVFCLALFVVVVFRKPVQREEEDRQEDAPALQPQPLSRQHVPLLGSVPLLPPGNPPLSLVPPALPVVETIPLPELKRYVVLVEALLATFECAMITVPSEYVDTLLSTFTECDNISYSKPDEQGRVRMRFLPPGAFPDGFLVA